MRSSTVNGGDVAAAAAAVELLKKANRIKPMPRVLVTGATGQQGGATVNALLAKGGFEIFALSRTPDSPKAKSLADHALRNSLGASDKDSSNQAHITICHHACASRSAITRRRACSSPLYRSICTS